MRRAVQAALDRSEIVAAHGLPADMTTPDCISVYMCGTTYANNAGGDIIRAPSLDRARALLKEAGYDNERIAILQPADSALINPMAMVVIDRLKRAGFNLDIQAGDWSSIAGRWVAREPIDNGGWNLVPVIYTGFDLADPLSNVGIGYNCTNNQPWGYCVEAMKPVLDTLCRGQRPGAAQGAGGRAAEAGDRERHLPDGRPVPQPGGVARRAEGGDRFRLPGDVEHRAGEIATVRQAPRHSYRRGRCPGHVRRLSDSQVRPMTGADRGDGVARPHRRGRLETGLEAGPCSPCQLQPRRRADEADTRPERGAAATADTMRQARGRQTSCTQSTGWEHHARAGSVDSPASC